MGIIKKYERRWWYINYAQVRTSRGIVYPDLWAIYRYADDIEVNNITAGGVVYIQMYQYIAFHHGPRAFRQLATWPIF